MLYFRKVRQPHSCRYSDLRHTGIHLLYLMRGPIIGSNASSWRTLHGENLRSSHITSMSSPPSHRPTALKMREVMPGEYEDASRLDVGSSETPLAPGLHPLSLYQGALNGMSAKIKSLFLPEGFPSSVTPDYLPYQLWSMPTHVTVGLSRFTPCYDHALVVWLFLIYRT